MLRAGTSGPPIAAAFKSLSLGLCAANYRLRCVNSEFKLAGIPVIPALHDHNLFLSGAVRRELLKLEKIHSPP
jgi:hypothetical protein